MRRGEGREERKEGVRNERRGGERGEERGAIRNWVFSSNVRVMNSELNVQLKHLS